MCKDIWTGDIGELSEAFTFFRILAHFSDIETIYKKENGGANLEFVVEPDTIRVVRNEEELFSVPKDEFAKVACNLLRDTQSR